MLNYFYELWNNNQNEQSDFKCLFFPWYQDKEYRMERDYEIMEDKTLQTVNNLFKEKKITKQQLNRYYNQYELLSKEVLQEFPSIPLEAFLTTGDPVREPNKIKSLPILKYKEDDKYRDLRIYQEPQTCFM